jgi:hypothetical protein
MLSPEFLQEAAYAAHEEVINGRDPIIPDRQAYPLWAMLLKRSKEMTFTRGKAILKMQKDGGLDIEHWDGRQVLTFSENRVDVQAEFTPRRTHLGVEFVHTQLKDEGYTVEPNGNPRGANFAKKISKAAADMVMDIFAQRIDDAEDAWDVKVDRVFHLDGTHDPLAPVGLDGLMPLDNTSGTWGGQPRTDPLFQHNVRLASTYGVGGTLERDLQNLIRLSEVNNRGTPSKIDAIQAGYGWIDRYIAYARANDMPYERNGGTSAVKMLDIGLPDSAIHFNGIPIIHNPTFETLDNLGLYVGTPWTRRAYMFASKTWVLGYQTGMLKQFSSPLDPADQRITRLSWDGRHVLLCKKPNGNAVSTVAA